MARRHKRPILNKRTQTLGELYRLFAMGRVFGEPAFESGYGVPGGCRAWDGVNEAGDIVVKVVKKRDYVGVGVRAPSKRERTDPLNATG